VLETLVTVRWTVELRWWQFEHAVVLPGVALAVAAPANSRPASMMLAIPIVKALFIWDSSCVSVMAGRSRRSPSWTGHMWTA
jgi:hypothetical protein